jgi:hypothetical protein
MSEYPTPPSSAGGVPPGETSSSESAPADDGTFTFKPIGFGQGSDRVTVGPGGVQYQQRYANWLTWTLVVFTVGLAALAWRWIRFGKRAEMLPRSQITSVTYSNAGRGVQLAFGTPTGVVGFRTNKATAERAQKTLMAGG